MPGTTILNEAQWQQGSGKLPDGRPVVAVSIDPHLQRQLRPHQVRTGLHRFNHGLKPEH